MEPEHPATSALLRAARSLRQVGDESDGTTLSPTQAEGLLRAITALGFAIADYLSEATVHSQTPGYTARLIPPGAGPAASGARIMAKAARDHRLPDRSGDTRP